MNEIQVFENPDFGEVRTLTINGEPWFVGKDIAKALGYEKTRNAIAAHVDDEDKTTALIQGTGSNYKSKTVIINESGMYSLIFGSKLPSAKAFKRWVTSEVLPAIRKTGCYAIDCKERKANINDISLRFKDYSGDYEQRKAWFTYMLTALSVKTMTPSKSLLHQAYEMMTQKGTDLNAETLIYFNETGVKASTFEVILSDTALSEQLADILVYNMKSNFIGIE